MRKIYLFLLIAVLILTGCKQTAKEESATAQEKNWVQLFNGEDLMGWEVKIAGYPAGENFGENFRVKDGLLVVNYDAYDDGFNNRFGHIYTTKEYSNYKLRVEYRFYGEPLADALEWAYLNNGAMLHSQSPESMHIDQWFPVSIEAQFLSCDEKSGDRTTGNVCTPGTIISIDGIPVEDHCTNSTSKAYPADEWVTMEMVVYADSLVHHIIEGDTIMTYTNLEIDGKGINTPIAIQPGKLSKGRIAFQSEGHPTQFRKIEILELD